MKKFEVVSLSFFVIVHSRDRIRPIQVQVYFTVDCEVLPFLIDILFSQLICLTLIPYIMVKHAWSTNIYSL